MIQFSRIKRKLITTAYSIRWRRERSYIRAFLSEMQNKGVSFGVTDAVWQTPSGMGIGNRVSPKDLVQIAAKTMSCDILRDIWSLDSAVIHVFGKNERDIELQHKLNYQPLRDSYQILGWKTGTWYLKERIYVCCVMAVKGQEENQVMLGAVMDCTGNMSAPDRYIALKELFDAASKGEGQPATARDDAPHAEKACCAIIRTDSNELFFPINQNAETLSVAASTTKLLSCLTALDYLSLDEKVKILSFDLVRGSGQIFRRNDVVTVEDLLYAALLPSSNQAATALARYAGKIIKKKKVKKPVS